MTARSISRPTLPAFWNFPIFSCPGGEPQRGTGHAPGALVGRPRESLRKLSDASIKMGDFYGSPTVYVVFCQQHSLTNAKIGVSVDFPTCQVFRQHPSPTRRLTRLKLERENGDDASIDAGCPASAGFASHAICHKPTNISTNYRPTNTTY